MGRKPLGMGRRIQAGERMNPALINLGLSAAAKPAKGRRVMGRATARYQREEEDTTPDLTHEQIEAEIVRILKRGDPCTPADLASEIGVAVAAVPYRIKALREKHRQVQYRVESNFCICWWRA